MNKNKVEKKVKIEKPVEKVVFPMDFDNIKVSTKTIIVITNMTINITNVFKTLPITDYEIIPKKRGRKKKTAVVVEKELLPGSIITLKYGNALRGVDLKQKKNCEAKSKSFRNSLTVVMMLEDKKMINFKISGNGKFQIVGCKSWHHAFQVVRNIWSIIKSNKETYTLPSDVNLSLLLIPAMRNIDFSTGFKIDREKLDHYIKQNTKYISILETSLGYTGVNIKFPLCKPITELDNTRLIQYVDDAWSEPTFASYKDYINALPSKEKKKLVEKKRFTTFLVFYSGKCIMSSINKSFMKDTYYEFVEMINKCRNQIEEKLNT